MRKRAIGRPLFFCFVRRPAYFVLGVSAAAGLVVLLLTSSAFLPAGVGEALTGDPVGDAIIGVVTGLAVAVGAGVAGGLTGSVLGSQAPSTAIPAVRTVDKIIDLLMIFPHLLIEPADPFRPLADFPQPEWHLAVLSRPDLV